MKSGKHLVQSTTRNRKSSRNRIKLATPMLVVILLVVFTVGGTVAWLTTHTEPVNNQFTPAQVSCAVSESFNGTTKSNVSVTNTSDIPAYVRIRLVSYRVNASGQRIGGAAEIPEFSPANGWVKGTDGMYYYPSPVAVNATAPALFGSITLASYNDADGGKQVIEVIAEAIQAAGVNAQGTAAVTAAWGYNPAA